MVELERKKVMVIIYVVAIFFKLVKSLFGELVNENRDLSWGCWEHGSQPIKWQF